MKGVRSYIQSLAISVIFLTPTIAYADASPQTAIMNVIQGFMGLLLVLAPSLGGLVLAFYGTQYYFASDAHKKADLKDNMKNTILAAILIFLASGIVKWVVSLVGQ